MSFRSPSFYTLSPVSKKYDAPIEVRELEELIRNFTYRNGLNVQDVFKDMLRYIVHGFSLPDTPPLSGWRYTQEQNKAFYEMYVTWVKIMSEQIHIHGWYDAFGELFMAFTSQRGQQESGQFFTPDDVSEVCRGIIMGKETTPTAIYDPAVGSGRLLISTQVEHPRNYLVGWDIDYTCCLMCVCNFLMNSCVGEVVCIDTLGMDNFQGAWLVNEAYYRTGLPSVRHLSEREYTLLKRADIPYYVYFLDQKSYDRYFHYKEIWQKISKLFNDGTERTTDKD